MPKKKKSSINKPINALFVFFVDFLSVFKKIAYHLVHYFRKRKLARKTNSFLFKNVLFDSETVLEGENSVYSYSNISGSFIGYGSFIGLNSSLTNCKIGRYCSISSDVIIPRGKHPVDSFVSSFSGLYSSACPPKCSFGSSSDFIEFTFIEKPYCVVIGNDVWIGSHVLIKEGIQIGDGAIIGMGSVVVKDVPPYSVVGGCPAKILKMRFQQPLVDSLLQIKWWNWEPRIIKERVNDFSNPEEFVKKYL